MPIYEYRSKAKPDFIIAIVRRVADIEVQPTSEEVRGAVSKDTPDSEVERLCSEGFERCPSRGTGLAQAPGYRAGGKGVSAGFNPGRVRR